MVKKIDFKKTSLISTAQTNIKKRKIQIRFQNLYLLRILKGKFWVPYMKSFNDTAYEKDNLDNYFVFVED